MNETVKNELNHNEVKIKKIGNSMDGKDRGWGGRAGGWVGSQVYLRGSSWYSARCRGHVSADDEDGDTRVRVRKTK